MFGTKLFEINKRSAEVTKSRDSQFYLCCGLRGYFAQRYYMVRKGFAFHFDIGAYSV